MVGADGAIEISGRALVSGQASGEIVFSDTPLSFWGGVESTTGRVIDQHHPLSGQALAGKILAIPGSRGSSSGSGIILELILNGCNPAALVFEHEEEIISVGVVVAEEIYGKSIPVICVVSQNFQQITKFTQATVSGGILRCWRDGDQADQGSEPSPPDVYNDSRLHLEQNDLALLDGSKGAACEVAMKIVCRMAEMYGANKLIDVTRAHIDSCVYTGPAGLDFAIKLKEMGAKVCVPTTLNAISIDRRRWREQGVDPAFSASAGELADAYVDMGCSPTFTCAPYLLETRPTKEEQVVWAESNAVVFANSVLGARTMKYPDYLDICIAICGRAPNVGCHVKDNRTANLIIDVEKFDLVDDAFFPLLGYQAGRISGGKIPLIRGIEANEIAVDDLKAFGAAFATVSGAPMFHILGVTPEANTVEEATGGNVDLEVIEIGVLDLRSIWRELNTDDAEKIDLVSLGNPHFSLSEMTRLNDLCRGKTKDERVSIIVTCSRATLEAGRETGVVWELEKFGVDFITDTCWCMIAEPIIPVEAKTLMTNSAKYAHYGPGLTGRKFRFGSLTACVEAVCSGMSPAKFPEWLMQ